MLTNDQYSYWLAAMAQNTATAAEFAFSQFRSMFAK